ncbi:hypothetical protein CR513_28601, partial [Mucuna pruriens]
MRNLITKGGGDRDVESYMDWELKVDKVLSCFDYFDYEKVKKITYEFISYALELKSRFVLASYTRDLYNRVQHMYQGFKSIEDYHKDMEIALTRANVLESNKAIMEERGASHSRSPGPAETDSKPKPKLNFKSAPTLNLRNQFCFSH